MFPLVVDHFPQNCETWLVAELFQLLAILGNIPALIDLQPPQGESGTADAIGQRVGFTGRC